VTSVHVEKGVDPEQIRTVARERFQVAMAGGLGPFAGRVFRIGHLGDMNAAMILGALSGIEAALHHLGIPIEDGVTKAVEVLSLG
jgi:alanine-glyoxylate transaminase/serine-glyoxylate transaminase/serine-pyruvate transaminase